MSTEITQQSGNTALTIHPDQTTFTPDQQAALQQLGVQANSAADVAVFFHQAKRSGLDPFKREIYMITRKGKATIQTGIDGFYKIADRATRSAGGTWGIPETLWCGPDGQWRDVWLERTPPAAAKVTVERDGSRFTTVALTSEYMADGPMWKKMPARMIAKCAEALAIRRAFPDDLSGLYTSEEMAQADNQPPAPTPSRQPVQPQQQGGSRLAQAMGQRPQPQQHPAPAPAPAPADEFITPDTWERIQAALAAHGYESDAQGKAIQTLLDKRIDGPQHITVQDGERLLAELEAPTPDADAATGEIVDEPTA